MLRRLTERHKCHAIRLLTGTTDAYSTLYGLPHRDNSVSCLVCPSFLLNACSYYVSHVIHRMLKLAGQAPRQFFSAKRWGEFRLRADIIEINHSDLTTLISINWSLQVLSICFYLESRPSCAY